MDGTWEIKAPNGESHRIKFLTPNFAIFIDSDIANPSVFLVNTYQIPNRDSEIVTITQVEHGYTACYIASRKSNSPDKNEYFGRWVDVTGKEGGFTFAKIT